MALTVSEILGQTPGLTYRQLDHWVTRGYLKPAGRIGRVRTFSPKEARVLRLMNKLVLAGINPEAAVRMARQHIRTGEPIRLGDYLLQEDKVS